MSDKKRIIYTEDISRNIISLIYEASFNIEPAIEGIFRNMAEKEKSPIAVETLNILVENAEIARRDEVPLCQDCGVVIVFIELGQDICLEGKNLEEAVNDAVKEAYHKNYLRKSIVADPLRRLNTGTNTPAFIHTDIVPGKRLRLTVYLKGGGSENMSVLKMFRPTDPVEDIIDYIECAVLEAGSNPCPPVFLGIGIGGTADTAVINSKRAVLRGIGSSHPDPFYRELEARILQRLNKTGLGPLGFGGAATAAGVYIMEAPTHIASLPVALNINCHSLRYRSVEL